MSRFPAVVASAVCKRTMAASALAVLAMAWTWQIVALHGHAEIGWLAMTALSVLTGFAALGWLRPSRVGITAPQAMMLFATVGMMAGLALDVRRAGLITVAAMCSAGGPGFVALARAHLAWLPLMHVGMAAGGLGALIWLRKSRLACKRQFCARVVQNVACSGWMAAGMVAGVLFYYRLAAWFGGAGVTAMFGGMIGGMVWGMVVSISLYRLFLRHAAPPGSTSARSSSAQAAALRLLR